MMDNLQIVNQDQAEKILHGLDKKHWILLGMKSLARRLKPIIKARSYISDDPLSSDGELFLPDAADEAFDEMEKILQEVLFDEPW